MFLFRHRLGPVRPIRSCTKRRAYPEQQCCKLQPNYRARSASEKLHPRTKVMIVATGERQDEAARVKVLLGSSGETM
jgi:hypothetical protein